MKNELPPLRAVLAATDLSAPSRHAADRLARVAAGCGAAMTLLHAAGGSALDELRHWMGQGGAAEQALFDQARTDLQQLAQSIGLRHGVSVAPEVGAGSAVDEIAAAAERLDAGLIALGVRGSGYLRRLVLGSTAEQVLRRSHRPVLVVRQTAHEAYRRVLVAVDFSPWTDATLDLAQQVAPGAHLVLMHAWTVPFEGKLRFAGVDEATVAHYRSDAQAQATRRLHQLAQDHGLPSGAWSPSLVQGDAWLGIVEQEQEQDCDLIAVGKHGRHAIEELLLGSVTKSVLGETQGDVLVATHPFGAFGA